MKKAHKEQLQLLARDWYRQDERGDKARALFEEHPALFKQL